MGNDDTADGRQEQGPAPAAPGPKHRRAYTPPTLIVYGDAASLTQSNRLRGKPDSGTGKLKLRTR